MCPLSGNVSPAPVRHVYPKTVGVSAWEPGPCGCSASPGSYIACFNAGDTLVWAKPPWYSLSIGFSQVGPCAFPTGRHLGVGGERRGATCLLATCGGRKTVGSPGSRSQDPSPRQVPGPAASLAVSSGRSFGSRTPRKPWSSPSKKSVPSWMPLLAFLNSPSSRPER